MVEPFHNRRLESKAGSTGTVSPWKVGEKLQQKMAKIFAHAVSD